MKIHPILATAILTATLALQGWMLNSISHLESDVAALRVEVHYLSGHQTAQNPPPSHERLNH